MEQPRRPAAVLDGLHHDRPMFGGSLPSAALAAALALDGMDGLEERHLQVMSAGRALCAALDAVLDPAVDAGVFVPDRNESWDGTLLTFNPTLLRRPVEELVSVFSDVAQAAGG